MTPLTRRLPSAYRAACPSEEKLNRAEYAPSWYTATWVFDTQILKHSDWRPHETDFTVCTRRNGVCDEFVGAGAHHRPQQKQLSPRSEGGYGQGRPGH